MLRAKQGSCDTNFNVIGLTGLGIKPKSTAPEADALTTRTVKKSLIDQPFKGTWEGCRRENLMAVGPLWGTLSKAFATSNVWLDGISVEVLLKVALLPGSLDAVNVTLLGRGGPL